MAVTGQGANKIIIDAGRPPVDAGMRDALVLSCTDTYTFDASDIANSLIEMQTPPAGSRIIGMHLDSSCAVSSLSFDVGDTNTINLYIDAAVGTEASGTTLNNGTGSNYVIGTNDDDGEILVKILGATAVGSITLTVYYARGGDSS
jgi:hypothetical protein